MAKGGGSAPAAPDPKVTIQAQTQANAETARLAAQLNRINQVGPTGSVTYSQGAPAIDRNKWINDQVEAERARIAAENARRGTLGGIGNAYDPNTGEQIQGATPESVPMQFDEAAFRAGLENQPTPVNPGQDQWTMTTTLSPEQQRLYDLTTQAQTTYGEAANDLLKSAKSSLSQPVDTDWESYRQKALAAQLSRIQPDYDRQQEQLRTRLANSGLTAGSEGWQREMDQFQRGYNDLMMQADLNAGNTVGQGIQQTAALRAMPLNEASVLLSGGQVQTPQLQQTPSVNVAPVDAMGAYNQKYQGELAAYNANQQRAAAGMGGAASLFGTLASSAMRYGPGLFALSDERAKEDIERIGTADNGLPLYSYLYKGDATPQVGVIAQDVAKVKPHAVARTPSGLLAVNYAEALKR